MACGGDWSVLVDDGTVATAVLSGIGNAANRLFNYGIFPPGAYQVRLRCNGSLLGAPVGGATGPGFRNLDVVAGREAEAASELCGAVAIS